MKYCGNCKQSDKCKKAGKCLGKTNANHNGQGKGCNKKKK